jgi:hypothetical protein
MKTYAIGRTRQKNKHVEDILVGTLFFGKIGIYEGLFLKAFETVVCLSNPSIIWTNVESVEKRSIVVCNFREVCGKLTIEE